ncbi:MAG: S1C family serine protease [Dongiaceae bacterium]
MAILAALLVWWSAMPVPARAESCDKPLVEVFRDVAPSVVLISAFSIDPFKLRNRIVPVIGSGVIFDAGGLIIANSHIVLNRTQVVVVTADGVMRPAAVLGADPILDLAVLRLDAQVDGLPAARLGDSDQLQVGDEVLAIGNSFGLEQTASHGIVSGLRRILPKTPMSWLQPLIQTDAAINPGNSGGPLVNRCGEVVGINSAMLVNAENIGFSVPANLAKEVIPQLIQQGRVIRPWYGINGKLVSEALRGLLRVPLVPGFLIETIEPGSPPERAGLRGGSFALSIGQDEFLLGGDIITKVNGVGLTDLASLVSVVNSLKVGDRVRLDYFRNGQMGFVDILLPERPTLPGDLPPEEGAIQ